MDEFFNGRGFMIVAALTAALAVFLSGTAGIGATQEVWQGVFYTFNPATVPPFIQKLINLLCLGGIATLLILLNKQYNFVKAFTWIFSSVFLLLSTVSMWMQPGLDAGLLMCLTLVATMFVIFAEYQQAGHSQRSIFLAMAAASTFCLFNYRAVFLIPVIFLGFVQVKAMSGKGVVAALFGLLTPPWIAVGLMLAHPVESFNVPDVASIWSGSDLAHLQLPIIIAALTALLTIVVTAVNLMTVLNYRLQTRMYNAFIVVMAVLTVLAMCFDFTHILSYLPILNVCLAIQIAHRATIGKRQLL